MKNLINIAWLGLILGISTSASASISYGFDCITNNNADNCSGTESTFSFSVTEDDPIMGQVTFTVKHAANMTMSDTGYIAEVYFDGAEDHLGDFISSDPEWNEMVSPPNLPSGNTVTPEFITDFAIDSDFTGQTPDAPIGPGEELDIVFLLDGTFAQLISAIDTGWLRLGLHVRSINVVGCNILDRDGQNTCDSSESYVSNVPVPAAVWMLGTGLLGLIGFSRRKL